MSESPEIEIKLPLADHNGTRELCVSFHKEEGGRGYGAEISVWVADDDSVSKMRSEAVEKTKVFVRQILKSLERQE